MIDDAETFPPSLDEFKSPVRDDRSPFIASCLRAVAHGVDRSCRAVVRGGLRVLSEYYFWRARRALQHLDDQLLADVGISRGEIGHAVRNGRPSRRSLGSYARAEPRLPAPAASAAARIAG
jgi:uncharacterized protein YjiS (DUF1127 family)